MILALPRRYPLLIPALGLGFGIYGAAHFPGLAHSGFFTWVVAGFCILFGWILRRNPSSLVCFLLGFFLLGALRLGDRVYRQAPLLLSSWVADKTYRPLWLKSEGYCQSEG